MFTREQAEAAVRTKLTEYASVPVAIIRVDEREYGWIFYWNSQKYTETKAIGDYLFGNGPVIFRKTDGSMAYLTTALPIDQQVKDYEIQVYGRTFDTE